MPTLIWIIFIVLFLGLVIYGIFQSRSGSRIGGNTRANPTRYESKNVPFFKTQGAIWAGIVLVAFILFYLFGR